MDGEGIRERSIDEADDPDDGVIHDWHNHEWTVQHVDFVAEFLRTANSVRAYRKAFADECGGISQPAIVARSHAVWRNNPALRHYVDFVRQQMVKRLELSKENVLGELAKLGFANMSDFVILQADGTPQFDLSGLSHEQAAAIQEMTIDTYVTGKGEDAQEVRSVKVKLAPKLGALELMGKHLKLFTDVVETRDGVDLADSIRKAREAKRKRQDERSGQTDGESGTTGEAGRDGRQDAGSPQEDGQD